MYLCIFFSHSHKHVAVQPHAASRHMRTRPQTSIQDVCTYLGICVVMEAHCIPVTALLVDSSLPLEWHLCIGHAVGKVQLVQESSPPHPHGGSGSTLGGEGVEALTSLGYLQPLISLKIHAGEGYCHQSCYGGSVDKRLSRLSTQAERWCLGWRSISILPTAALWLGTPVSMCTMGRTEVTCPHPLVLQLLESEDAQGAQCERVGDVGYCSRKICMLALVWKDCNNHIVLLTVHTAAMAEHEVYWYRGSYGILLANDSKVQDVVWEDFFASCSVSQSSTLRLSTML